MKMTMIRLERHVIIIALVMVGGVFAGLIPPDEQWPGTYGTVDGYPSEIVGYWIPDSIEVFRGIWIDERFPSSSTGHLKWPLDHDPTCVAASLRFCRVYFGSDDRYVDESISADELSNFIDAMAQQTGHPEISNCPIVVDGQINKTEMEAAFPGRIICMGNWFPCGGCANTTVYFQGPEEGDDKKEEGDFSYSGSGNKFNVYAPKWGWPHGYYSHGDFYFPFVTQMVKLRVPADWDPLSGPPTLLAPPSDYRGDPGTWYGEWPEYYPSDQLPDDLAYSAGVWLPNKYIANLWRAFSSRHPTLTQKKAGEGYNGSHFNNWDLSAGPKLSISNPTRPYNIAKQGGTKFPVYAKNSKIQVELGCGYDGFDTLFLYDGDRLLGKVPHNDLGIYRVRECLLSETGIRALIAVATWADGKKVTSRPAILYVTDAIGEIPNVSAAPSAAVTPRILKSHTLTRVIRRDFRGVVVRRQLPNGKGMVEYTVKGREIRPLKTRR
ncbi:MAG: hypothetical protein GF344_10145 [Chitinivibrionales bacterium]|nr:hypothetical protein [Chitinivibrionales bacterium]MBD3357195.1 hypothetical protein [Chitinivibrionales bacterium]